MPNGIKYSASAETRALKKGNFWIGTGDVDKAPTQVTGYWASITPPVGGYSVYINRPSGGPSIYNPADDSELITVTRNLSGTTFATGPSALNWYNSQTDYMCMNIDYPAISTNGLVLDFDAGFTPSYPRGGAFWYNVGPSGSNGLLANGASWTSATGGSILFDGTDDYVRIGSSSAVDVNQFTWSSWVDGTYSNTPGLFFIGSDVGQSITPYKIFIGIQNDGGTYRLRVNYNNVATVNLGSLTNNILYNLVISYDGTTTRMYINGASIGSSTAMSGNLTSKTFSYIASTAGAFEFFRGNIYNTFFYNRALSSQEVLGTYQAIFPRFLGQNIVMSNLVGYWNAGYRTSYPGSGTSWFDVSGYGNTGTLTNGPSYSSATGGSIVFDGADDYVSITGISVTSATFDFWFTPVNKGSGFGYVMAYGTNTVGQMVSISIANQSLAGYLTSGEIYCFLGGELDSALRPSGFVARFGAVYNVVLTVSNLSTSIGMYINGINYPITNSTPVSLGSTFNMGRWFNPAAGNYLKGNINSGKVYSRVLSPSEVLQNYQATLPQILGENIVTSGLVSYYDAGYATSYGGAGTVWTNVSGVAGATGSLTNGPTYATGNGGAIVFDGTDDYVNCGTDIRSSLQGGSSVTFEGWYNLANVTTDDGLFTIRSTGGRSDGDWFWNIRPGGSLFWVGYSTSSSLSVREMPNPFLTRLNTWTHILTTYTSGSLVTYINGVLYDSFSGLTGTVNITSGSVLTLANYSAPGTFSIQGRLSMFRVYNRAISAQEVSQNFNATRGRFGI